MPQLSLFYLLILGAEGLRVANPESPLFRPEKQISNLKSKDQNTLAATQKFKLYRGEHTGEWNISCGVRGLALGGWFVPEKFINIKNFKTPDMKHMAMNATSNFTFEPDATGTIYEGYESEGSVCELSKKLGRAELDARMKEHLANFIKEDDFKYIASTGVNTLRIPVAYWNFIEDPYEIYAPIKPSDSLLHLDNAMKWAQKYDLAVILDLHASPGSQNGWEHSGCRGHAGLFQGRNASQNQNLSLLVLENMAQRYAGNPALLGIEVINEPTGYKQEELTKLYKASYDAIRKYDNEVWVIVYAHNADRVKGLKEWHLHNLIVDKHNYACFGDGRSGPPGVTYDKHAETAKGWKKHLHELSILYPTLMGEWSLCHGGGTNLALGDWNQIQQDAWQESTVGAVFWTYKLMTDNARWSYRVTQDTVDVMGDLPRCQNEKTVSHRKLPNFMLHGAKKVQNIDAGYEWVMGG